eukprot:CAMPEP_0118935706 /NCGR_PEP_ID=MMETSP1169-20130426/15784_1 /TAXON_ID=36882 /ORGANISM="Pyramimonas obovata, Strain CCMP722" /LENGTH=593 /DNA_ID=CAMNT_0006878765 /DNA_START=54 /DNA_END=1835 /DNA_ORIENTATION=+
MPTVGVNRDLLMKALGREYTEEEFDELCFEFGIELDEVTTEGQMVAKMAGQADVDIKDDDELIYKIDIPANRYDLLCLEGLSMSLNVFRQVQSYPNFRVVEPKNGQRLQMVVKPETLLIRPFVVCAVLRGVTLDKARYDSFIDLQDKLHQNICRKRSLVAIGTHDLSTIQGPFSYEALPPEDIKFVPLKQTQEFNAKDLLDHYKANDLKLKAFVPLIQSSPVYPVIYDANRTVLSLPPIINGSHSAISLDTKDVFIECTATDLNKARIVLNTMVTMFSCYCNEPFTVEPVDVTDSTGAKETYPDLTQRKVEVDMSYINARVGVHFEAEQAAKLLTKMCLDTAVTDGGNKLCVSVPPTRSDVLHPCDIMEDVAIAYGFNNLPMTVPKTVTVGKQLPVNCFSDLIRNEMAMAGFTEVLTWILGSKSDNFELVNRPADVDKAALIGNAKTVDFECVRTSLVPGLLKTLGSNKEAPLPVKIFEVSDVVELDAAKDVGAKNIRRAAALFCGATSGFEVVHGLLDRLMEVMGVPEGEGGYTVVPDAADGCYFPGRAASVYFRGAKVGGYGVVHPEVLGRFGSLSPASVMELDLEPFLAL